MMKTSLACLLLFTMSCACWAGTTYYAAPNGNDANSGLDRKHPKTLNGAVNFSKLNPGDTVIALDGVYPCVRIEGNCYHGLDVKTRSGLPGRPITIKSEHKWGAILDGSAYPYPQYVTEAVSLNNVSYVNFDDFEVRYFADGFRCSAYGRSDAIHHVTIKGNHIHHIVGNGWAEAVYADRNTFTGNVVHTEYVSPEKPGYNHGIYSCGDHQTITNNVFYNCNDGRCIQLAGYDTVDTAIIANNVFAWGANADQIVLWAGDPVKGRPEYVAGLKNVTVENNIFWYPRAGMHAIDVYNYGDFSNVKIRNNVLYGGTTGLCLVHDAKGPPPEIHGNSDNPQLDPGFVNVPVKPPGWSDPVPDFHLKAGSPAIGKGITDVAPNSPPNSPPRLRADVSIASSTDYGGYRPHYQGFGVKTAGGRGGALYRVTNLNDSGPGSLRDALQATGARIVIFEISGSIRLSSPLYITHPYLTIAGQTAPAPGITITHHPLFVDTHDVVLQHFRMRLGDTYYSGEHASLTMYLRQNLYNVVLDHLSLSWSTAGGTIGVNCGALMPPGKYPQWRDLAILDTLISEGLNKSAQWPGPAILFYPSGDASTPSTGTLARNMFVFNSHRIPWLAGGQHFAGFNNFAYGAHPGVPGDDGVWGYLIVCCDYEGQQVPGQWVWIGNVAQNSADSGPYIHAVKVWFNRTAPKSDNKLYLSDNTGPHMTIADQWGGVKYLEAATEALVRTDTVPSWFSKFKFSILPNASVKPFVTANAGARPAERSNLATRDATDYRVVEEANNGTGSRISSQNDVGGYPVIPRNTRSLTIPTNPNSVAPGQTFRTNIEVWLETYARDLEPAAGGGRH